jgi:hypothetical protein
MRHEIITSYASAITSPKPNTTKVHIKIEVMSDNSEDDELITNGEFIAIEKNSKKRKCEDK